MAKILHQRTATLRDIWRVVTDSSIRLTVNLKITTWLDSDNDCLMHPARCLMKREKQTNNTG